MERAERAIHWIGQQTGWLYVAIVMLIILETALRTAFNAPTIWTLELSLMLAGAAYLLNGASFGQASGHIRIDLLYRRLSGWRKRLADTLTAVVGMAYLGVVAVWGGQQAMTAIAFGERSGSAWNSVLPMVHKSMIPVAAVLMGVALICEFIRLLSDKK